LSTHIVPKERLNRIRKLRDPDNKKRKVIISTPLIEAGVDIDVDVVYRDMAPLDSINRLPDGVTGIIVRMPAVKCRLLP